MAAKTFHCEIVTPGEKLLDEEVTYASIPAWDGLFGVLPGRAPIVASLGAGELRVDFPEKQGAAGGSRSYFIDGGVCRMSGGRLTIIAEAATPAERLTVGDAEAELREAEARQVPADLTGEVRRTQTEQIRHQRQAARARLRLARQHAGQPI